ncbi:MAG TPA: Gfo/Idh/MocA family oxidoreductase [Afipia sp.]
MNAALIGLGRMGLRHLEVLNSLHLDVVSASDRFEQTFAKAEEAGLTRDRLFTDPFDMIRALKPECIVVATTAPSHCDLVCAAAEAGAKFVLCEKPMAVSLAECDRMIAACDKAGTHLAINHQMRFMEQYTLAKEIVTGAAFGGLGSVNVVAGNFGMSMNGSHYFEMFRYMTDEEPTIVNAWFSKDAVPNPRGAEFQDRAGSVRVCTASGKRFYMDTGTDQGHGMFVSYGGRFGRLDIDELAGRMRLVARKAEHRDQPTTRYGMPWDTEEGDITPADAVAPTRAVLSALLAKQNYPDGRVGRSVVRILVAAYLSDERGGATIDLKSEKLPADRVFPWA